MSSPVGISVVIRAIGETERVIARQRAVIAERTSRGKPVDALRPVLSQMEGNLHVLTKVQGFLEARSRHLPGRA